MKILVKAVIAIGYSHGTVPTVTVKGQDGQPLIINESDFDEKTHKKWTGKEPGADAGTNANTGETVAAGEVMTTAAPSAPNFGSEDDGAKLPVDEVKQAAAPIATTSDQLLVLKSTKGATKGKFVIVNGGDYQPVTGDRAKLLGIDEAGYDTQEAANKVVSTTEPSPAP